MMKIMRNKKAQNTAEYAILIALVIGGVVAMQTYAQRALQGRIRDASIYMRDQTSQNEMDEGGKLGRTLQYEPYYTNTTATSAKAGEMTTTETGRSGTSNVTKTNSTERTEYNNTDLEANL